MAPGQPGWEVLKLGLTVAAFATPCSALCGGAAAVMSAVDMGRAIANKDPVGAVTEGIGLATFGAGRVAAFNLKVARASHTSITKGAGLDSQAGRSAFRTLRQREISFGRNEGIGNLFDGATVVKAGVDVAFKKQEENR